MSDASTARCGVLIIEMVDLLAVESDLPAVLTALGAVVLVQLERANCTVEQFIESLHDLKVARDANLAAARRRKDTAS